MFRLGSNMNSTSWPLLNLCSHNLEMQVIQSLLRLPLLTNSWGEGSFHLAFSFGAHEFEDSGPTDHGSLNLQSKSEQSQGDESSSPGSLSPPVQSYLDESLGFFP